MFSLHIVGNQVPVEGKISGGPLHYLFPLLTSGFCGRRKGANVGSGGVKDEVTCVWVCAICLPQKMLSLS